MVFYVTDPKRKTTKTAALRELTSRSLILFLLASLVACGHRNVMPVTAATVASTPSKSPTKYAVHVDVREMDNRVVEGTVREHRLVVDQPKQFGGDDTAPTPPETLAFALGSCVVSTGRLLAKQSGFDVKKLEAVVDGELDFAKALGTPNSGRAGFRGFRIFVTIDGSLSDDDRRTLLAQIEERCPICNNLIEKTPLNIALKQSK